MPSPTAVTKLTPPPEVLSRLKEDPEYKPLADGLTKWRDYESGDVYFCRHFPDGTCDWFPMQGKKSTRPKKLPKLATAAKSGEPLLFDPTKFVQGGQRTSAV